MVPRLEWIEQKYDDAIVVQAGDLYTLKSIVALEKVDKTLFIAQVRDGQLYDVEIKSPFTRLQKSTCTCDYHQKYRFCKHSIAVLFALRDQKNHTDKPSKLPKSLTINHIIDKISYNELKDFVINQARTDKKLALKLKIHFAKDVDTEDNVHKYKKILDSLIKPYTGKSAKDSTYHDVRLAVQTLKDFLGQIGDFIALGQYRDALEIMKASFPKALYLHKYYNASSKETEDVVYQYHAVLKDLLNAPLPRDIQIDVMGYLQEISLLSYYKFLDMENNVISISLLPRTKEWHHQWIEHLEVLIPKTQGENPLILWALLLWIQNSITQDNKIALNRMRLDHVIQIIDFLQQKNQFALTIELIQYFLTQNTRDMALRDRLLLAYTETRQKKEVKDLALQMFTTTAHIKYLNVLDHQLAPKAFEKILESIEKKVSSSPKQVEALINFYLSRQQIKNVFLWLNSIKDIHLLQKYEDKLHSHSPSDLQDLYRHLIKKGLEEEKITLYDVQNLMGVWRSKRWHNLAKNISALLEDRAKNKEI